MAKCIGSCGHEVPPDKIFTNAVTVRSIDREGRHVAKYLLLCSWCLLRAKILGVILKDERAINRWLRGGNEKGVTIW